MRITTLGPLAVDGRPVRGERLATVLRTLVDARGRAVSTGALVDAVWPAGPPDDAAGALQALVGRVRRLGVPVRTTPGGYLVPSGEVQIDATEARALAVSARESLAKGDTAKARIFAYDARARFPEVPTLDDADQARLFRDIALLAAEASLAGGNDVSETDLRRLTDRIPPDEPAAALLVRALAAQGRDAEALALVERVRADGVRAVPLPSGR